MKTFSVLFCVSQLLVLFPRVTPSTSDGLHLVRCLKTISDQYLPRTKTLAVAWTHNYLLYHNRSSFGTPESKFDDRGSCCITHGTLYKLEDVNKLVNLLLSELSLWTVVTYGNTVERRRSNYDVFGGYIVLTASVIALRDHLQRLSSSNSWNPRARFVVALVDSLEGDPPSTQRLLEELWRHRIINAVVIVPSEVGEGIPALNAYTWYPYQSSGRCTEVQHVTLMDSWVKKGDGHFIRNSHLFPQKINKNFHGCPIRIITQETIFAVQNPYFISVSRSNITKLMYRDGWEVKLLRIITKTLNMTEHYLRPVDDFFKFNDDKGRYAGFTRELLAGRADVSIGLLVVRGTLPTVATTPYHWGQLSWYVPCGSTYPRWMSISRMFSGSVWALLMTSVVLSSPVITFLASVTGESLYKTQSNSFCSTWASILSVSVPAMPRAWSLRCFFMSWVCYSLAVDTVFQAYLTSFLIDPGIMPHPANVEELARSDMKLGFAESDGVFYRDRTDDQARHIMAKKVDCDLADPCYIWAKKYQNLSILTSDLLYKFQTSQNLAYETGSNSLCQIEDGVIEHGPIVMVLAKGSALLDQVNDIILRAVEAGFFAEWVKMTNHLLMVKENASFRRGLSDDYCKLSLEHLQSAFYLLLLGYGVSCLVFFTQHIGESCLFSRN